MNTDINKPLVVVSAPVGTRSGYGTHSRMICTALIKSGKYDVRIIPTAWGQTPNDALIQDNPEHVEIIRRMTNRIEKTPDIFLQITIPNEFLPGGKPIGRRNIGITAVVETTVCRPEWINGCNGMDLVIATSEHSKRVLLESRYNFPANPKTGQSGGTLSCITPIEVLFEGIDTNVFYKTNSLHQTVVDKFEAIEEEFCFLFVGHWLQGKIGEDRKDVGMLIHNFIEAFKDKSPRKRPALILKTSGAGFSKMDLNDIKNKLEAILGQYVGKARPKIYLLHGDLTDEEMNSLYNHPKVKAFVTFTRGEGYGLPLAEFSTTGKPIIAPNWSGHTDFLDPKHTTLLPGELQPVHPSATNDWIIKESKWFRVDYELAKKVLQDVFDNYDHHLKKASGQKKNITKNFTLEKMQERLVELIDNQLNTSTTPNVPSLSGLPKLKKV
jgi:glycosyltransferase involved in cell wall biosynthesis